MTRMEINERTLSRTFVDDDCWVGGCQAELHLVEGATVCERDEHERTLPHEGADPFGRPNWRVQWVGRDMYIAGDPCRGHRDVKFVPVRLIAVGRDEQNQCEKGTVGCSVDHTLERVAGFDGEGSCETW